MLNKNRNSLIGFRTNENIKSVYGLPYNLKYPLFFYDSYNYVTNSIYSSSIDSVRKYKMKNIANTKSKYCMKGLKYIKNLPVRGQRTHKNARTRKLRKIL